MLVSKYGDHLPLHRQEKIYERQGVHLARSTLCNWVGSCAEVLGCLVNAMAKDALSAHCIAIDATGVLVQAKDGSKLRVRSPEFRATVDDVVQQTWFAAFTHLDALREPAALAGWLRSILHRECLRAVNRAHREMPVVEYALGAPVSPALVAEWIVQLFTSPQQG